MPGARCTRGLVCKAHKRKRTRAYRFSGDTPASPTQWFYGLCRALPGERIRLVTVAAGLMALRSGRIVSATGSLTPATGARTTRFYRTQQPVFANRLYGLWRRSSCAPMLAHGQTALRTFACRRCRVHRISTRVRDDRDPPLVWVRRAD